MIPPSPTHRRRTSSTSVHTPTSASPRHKRRISSTSLSSRRSSRAFDHGELYSPTGSFFDPNDLGSSIGPTGADELGNLADELAEAWDEDADYTMDTSSSQLDGSLLAYQSPPRSPLKHDPEKIRDSGIDVISRPGSSPASSPQHKRHPSNAKIAKRKPRRSSIDEADLDTNDDLPKSLLAHMKDIESMRIQGDDTIEEDPDREPVSRLAASLKDVGAHYLDFETHTTRLVTAHTSLALHLARTTRTLQSLSYFLLSPLFTQLQLDDEQYEDLHGAMSDALEALPQPTTDALVGLGRLHSTSKDNIASLSNLSDSLHMSRQASAVATRKLNSTKDMVSQYREELRLADEGRLWIEQGQWERKLADREAAKACRDILTGFEDTCDRWRDRLSSGGHGQVAAT